jgi:hypothetical protein
MRGRDYAAKVKGRRGGAPAGWQPAPKQVVDTLLPEDYVVCIAEDDAGLIWLGFRQQGYLALDPKTNKRVFEGNKKADGLPDDYVSALLPTSDFRPWVGTYGGGVGQAKQAIKGAAAKGEPATAKGKSSDRPPALPLAAKPPTLAELKDRLEELSKAIAKPATGRTAAVLPDDWRTQGDFYGADKLKNYRYGEWHAMLCAFAAPFDAVWGRKGVPIAGRLGLNRTKDDSLRHWVHDSQTNNVRSLKNPYEGGRRQSEWDDHGEAYPMSHEGPHIYVTIIMPPGNFYLSFYIFNKDGHDDNNRFRDYLITVKQYCETDADFARAPALAQGRVNHFWGGVYKVFAVKGGQKYSVQVHDNWSFNTILSGVFVDAIVDPPERRPYTEDIPRVQYAFQASEAEELARKAADNPRKALYQALGTVGALEQWRGTVPLTFAPQARRQALPLQRLLREDTVDPSKDLLLRARAECLHWLQLYDLRDATYEKLGKP